jgi:hypothetical protein
MKVFIQIPCLNEQDTLAGSEEYTEENTRSGYLEILIRRWLNRRNDCCRQKHGVKQFVIHNTTKDWLDFHDGVDYALAHGADIGQH